MTNPMHIGLLPQGGKNWIAGVIYLQNIIRAVAALPKNERPRLSMIMELLQERSIPEDMRLKFPEFLYYTYDQKMTFFDKCWMVKYSLQTGRWPRSMATLVRQKQIDVLFPVQDNLGKNFPAPWIGWIPDFQHKRLPQYFPQQDIKVRDEDYEAVIKNAAHIIVSSQDAQKDLMTFFPTDKSRVSVLPFMNLLEPEDWSADPRMIVDEYKLPQKFLIFPSQFWVHKNHRIVFEALKIIKSKGLKDIKIVFTGQNFDYRAPKHFDELMAIKDQYGISEQVIYLGLLPRHKQLQLMRAAAAVLQPSYFEGWSALVEDARALNKRIYLSDIAVHHEQLPPNAVFFDPNNAQQLADIILKEWNGLKPGPDLEKETAARKSQSQNAILFAKTFLQIVERTLKSQ